MNPQPAPTLKVFKHLAIPLAQAMAWTLPILAAVGVIAYPRAAAWGAQASLSIWAFVIPQMATWFLFSMAIALVSENLRVHVAMGVSRRRFTTAAAMALGGGALIFGLVAVLGLQLEASWYEGAGWIHGTEGEGFLARTGNAWLFGAEVMLSGLALSMSGLLVGWSYQFTRSLPATALLLVTAILPLGLSVGLLSDPRALIPLGIDVNDLSVPVRALAALALSALLFLIGRWLLSRLALRPRVP